MNKKNTIYNTKHAIQNTVNDTYFLHFSQLYILSPGNRTDLVIPLKIKLSYFLLVLQYDDSAAQKHKAHIF